MLTEESKVISGVAKSPVMHNGGSSEEKDIYSPSEGPIVDVLPYSNESTPEHHVFLKTALPSGLSSPTSPPAELTVSSPLGDQGTAVVKSIEGWIAH
jgi:hypothetical protein